MSPARTTAIRCPVYLHPAAASNPAVIASIQQATGQLIVLAGGRPQLKQRHSSFEGFGPFGGAA